MQNSYITSTKMTEIHMMNYLNDVSLCNYSQCNKKINKLFKSSIFWYLRIKKLFGDEYLELVKQVNYPMMNWIKLYISVRHIYCDYLKIPRDNIYSIYDSDFDLSDEFHQWNSEKFKLAFDVFYPFNINDILTLASLQQWDIINNLPCNTINNQIRTDIYFITNYGNEFVEMLKIGMHPSQHAWISMFYVANGFVYSKLVSSKYPNLKKHKQIDNISKHHHLFKLCFINNIKPQIDPSIKSLSIENIMTLLDFGLIISTNDIYDITIQNHGVFVLDKLSKYANFNNFLDYDCGKVLGYWNLHEIENLIKRGIYPSQSLYHINSYIDTDKNMLEYLKLLDKYKISIPIYKVLNILGKNNYEYSYDYVKSSSCFNSIKMLDETVETISIMHLPKLCKDVSSDDDS